jgi:hypothetical protein
MLSLDKLFVCRVLQVNSDHLSPHIRAHVLCAPRARVMSLSAIGSIHNSLSEENAVHLMAPMLMY